MSNDIENSQNLYKEFTKDEAFQTLGVINYWIGNIDTKVSFALAFIGILIGTIFSKGSPESIQVVDKAKSLLDLNGEQVFNAALVVFLYITSLTTIIFLILALIARVQNNNNAKSVFFFGTLASMKYTEYKNKVAHITENDIIEELIEQIHTNSIICNKKSKYYNKGIKSLLLTVIIWFICMVFGLI